MNAVVKYGLFGGGTANFVYPSPYFKNIKIKYDGKSKSIIHVCR